MEDNAQTGGRNSLRGNICQRPAIIIIYRCTHTNLKYALFCNLRPCKKLMDCSPFFSHLLLHAIKQIFWAHSARGNWPLIINQQNMRRKTRFNKTMHFDKYTVRIIYLLQKSNLKLRCSKWRPINVFLPECSCRELVKNGWIAGWIIFSTVSFSSNSEIITIHSV